MSYLTKLQTCECSESGVGSDLSDGLSVVVLHLDPGHHLHHQINRHTLPDQRKQYNRLRVFLLIVVGRTFRRRTPPVYSEGADVAAPLEVANETTCSTKMRYARLSYSVACWAPWQLRTWKAARIPSRLLMMDVWTDIWTKENIGKIPSLHTQTVSFKNYPFI